MTLADVARPPSGALAVFVIAGVFAGPRSPPEHAVQHREPRATSVQSCGIACSPQRERSGAYWATAIVTSKTSEPINSVVNHYGLVVVGGDRIGITDLRHTSHTGRPWHVGDVILARVTAGNETSCIVPFPYRVVSGPGMYLDCTGRED